MIAYLTAGVLLGLSAGFAPGPLLTLVISQTLAHGLRSGIMASLAPILTDAPIVAVCVFALSRLAHQEMILGVISLVGAVVVFRLGLESWKVKSLDMTTGDAPSKSLQKAALVNLLSPHPYIFWISVGGPTVIKAHAKGLDCSLAFVAGFYLLLIGSKVFCAYLSSKARTKISGRPYMILMKTLGAALFAFAFFLAKDGIDLLSAG